jgi:N-acetylglucosaminyl-diphospho-decaprenol L-rhamnosyltransferase
MNSNTISSPPQSSPLVGVCVLTYNSEDVIGACLEALCKALRNTPHEIVVVDNDSADKSVLTAKHYPNVEVICNPSNLGYPSGNNIGGRYLLNKGCKYLAFVNPDVTVRADTLDQMLAVLTKNLEAGCVGGVAIVAGRISKGCFRNRPTLIQKLWLYSSARYFPILGSLLKNITQSLELSHFIPLTCCAQPVYAVSGACILFPADSFARINGFDEATLLFQEEFIISERLRLVGQKVYGCPHAIYDHLHGHSVSVRPRQSYYFFIKSEQHLAYAYYKWSSGKRILVKLARYLDLAIGSAIAEIARLWRALQ